MPQHLKDMTGALCREQGSSATVSTHCPGQHHSPSKVPRTVRPHFFGANLTALTKKDGEVRPIAVVCTLRWLAAKLTGRCVMDAMGELLAPHQLGYGTKLSCKAAVHAAHLYLSNLQPGQVILKLDFQYAFNCICRDKMIQAVSILAPELGPFVHASYSEPSSLSGGRPHSCHRKAHNKVTPLIPCSSASPSTSSPPSWGLNFAFSTLTMGPWVEMLNRPFRICVWWSKVQES